MIMTASRVASATAVLFLATLMGTGNPATDPDRSWPAAAAGGDPAAEVVAASRAIVTAFGRDDPDAYFQLFDPAATFIFHATPRRLESRAAYEQEWAAWRKDLRCPARSCTASDQKAQLFGDVAVLTHLVRTEIATREGDATLHEHLPPQTDAAANQALVERLTAQADRWDKAIVRKDRAAIEANMADDFRQIDRAGNVETKKSFVDGLVSPELEIDPYVVEDFDVRLYGDVALLSGRTRMTGRYQGKPFASHYRYIDVYVRSGDEWKIVSVQISPLPSPAAP